MSKALAFAKKEFLDVLPPTVFFFIAFHIIALTRELMLKEQGVTIATTTQATIAALIVAKVLLIADHLPFINKFPEKPLIYNIAWKTALYMAASFVVRFIEALIEAWPETGGLSVAYRSVIQELSWPRFFAIQIWLLVLLLLYTTARELIRAIGRDRVVAMVFKHPDAGSV